MSTYSPLSVSDPWAEMQHDVLLDILYQDASFIAINKPAGLLVHRSKIDRGETRFALQMLRDQVGQHVYPVHRLDKPTSGVLVFAFSPDDARALAERFVQRAVTKKYLAVVRGYVDAYGVIDYPLKERRDRMTDARARRDKPAQPAVTAYRRVAQVEVPFAVSRYPTSRYSLIEVEPQTGRMHQIRRHMKHIFHPIIGDAKYGEGRHNRFFETQYGSSRLLLAATRLSFQHPHSQEMLTLKAPLDPVFASVLDQLGWHSVMPGISDGDGD